MPTTAADKGPVSRSDIEAKLREIKGEVDTTASSAKPMMTYAVAGAAVAVVALVFLIGRKSGKKRTTVVEIRRV